MRTKEQIAQYHKEWMERNKDKAKQYYKKYHDKTQEKRQDYYIQNKDRIKSNQIVRQTNNYEQRLYSSCKRTSIKKNLAFDLELCDIIIPEYCPYLGMRITNILGQGRVWSNASVDRIDPEKGYVKGNIEIISMKANTMKQNATKEELIYFSKMILTRHDL